jgi:1,6-anhydro-N-acetylmuramate kinase
MGELSISLISGTSIDGVDAVLVEFSARSCRLTGRAAQATAEFGISPDWVEGAAFAWLARARPRGAAGNDPSVTGAHQAVVPGRIYYGSIPATTPQQFPSGRAEPKTA